MGFQPLVLPITSWRFTRRFVAVKYRTFVRAAPSGTARGELCKWCRDTPPGGARHP